MSKEIIEEIFRLRTKLTPHAFSSNTIHSMTIDPKVFDSLAYTLFEQRHSVAPWGDWKFDAPTNTITLYGIKILKGER